jgi:hypothetical protein
MGQINRAACFTMGAVVGLSFLLAASFVSYGAGHFLSYREKRVCILDYLYPLNKNIQ